MLMRMRLCLKVMLTTMMKMPQIDFLLIPLSCILIFHLTTTYKEEKLVLKDNEKWRTVDKQTYSDLAISSLVQLPPGEPLNPPLLKSSKLSEYTIKKRVLDSYEQAYGTGLSDLNLL